MDYRVLAPPIAREAHYIRKLKCVNKVIPNRTTQEYIKDNKEKIKEKKKDYCEANKDKRKEYYRIHKETLGEKYKQYYKDHKEDMINYQKLWKEQNKDKIKDYNLKKYSCECGSVCFLQQKNRHFRTMKHQEYLKSSNLVI